MPLAQLSWTRGWDGLPTDRRRRTRIGHPVKYPLRARLTHVPRRHMVLDT